MRQKTSKKAYLNKFKLVTLGIVVAVVLVEIILQVSGLAYKALNTPSYKIDTKNEKEIRILCLGESTTAFGNENSYPSKLEEMLSKSFQSNKFVVINQGKPAADTNYLLSILPDILKKYKPHIVITMIGINDDWGLKMKSTKLSKFLSNFKLYRLIHFTKLNLANYLKEKEPQVPKSRTPLPPLKAEYELFSRVPYNNLSELNEYLAIHEGLKKKYPKSAENHLILSALYNEKQEYVKAKANLEKAMSLTTLPNWAYLELGKLNLSLGEWQLAHQNFQKFVSINKQFDEYLIIASIYQNRLEPHGMQKRDFSQYKRYLDEAYKVNPKSPEIHTQFATYYAQKNNKKKQIFHVQKALQYGSKVSEHHLKKGEMLFEQGKRKEAKMSFKRALELSEEGVHWPDWQAVINFYINKEEFKIAKAELLKAKKPYSNSRDWWDLHDKLAKHTGEFARKRPNFTNPVHRHDIDHPKTYENYREIIRQIKSANATPIVMQYPVLETKNLEQELSHEVSIIISNEQNFKKALETHSFEELFIDRFAGRFGHFTPFGADLIVKNIVQTFQEHKLLQ